MGNEWNWTVCNYKLQLVFTWLHFVLFSTGEITAITLMQLLSSPLSPSILASKLQKWNCQSESRAKTHLLWQEVRLSAALRNISLHKQGVGVPFPKGAGRVGPAGSWLKWNTSRSSGRGRSSVVLAKSKTNEIGNGSTETHTERKVKRLGNRKLSDWGVLTSPNKFTRKLTFSVWN